jgi:hypothetical protein
MPRKIPEGSGCSGYYIGRKLMIGRILASIVRVVKSRRLQLAGCAAGRKKISIEFRWGNPLENSLPLEGVT